MTATLRLLFRCDGGQAQGLGHITRCLSLARTIREIAPLAHIAFWGQYDAFARTLLAQHDMPAWPSSPPEGNADGIEATHNVCADFDVLLLDSYAIDQDYINGLKKQPCKLALIDDDQRHDLSDADLVLCFRAGAETLTYGARHQLLGPAFMLVKPELRALRERNLGLPAHRCISRALIFLSGGHRAPELLPTVLGAFEGMGLEIAYLAPEEPRHASTAHARHLPLTPAIETLYANTDFVLCGGGLTKYECAYAGIPNACLSLTSLQNEDTRIMAAQGFTLDLGLASALHPERLRGQLAEFIRDETAQADQRRAFASKLDGDGPLRVARTLLSL
ncbi:hypothetical protein [Pseudazoarcus pumilus]|uniref:hypothetical protein n=1 Tax=Pseudazoarcus pumilus TaxID=2067960 RepID=UPI000F5107E8|nr:hypothetical protein [Pseudazoarcus pumilus]